MRYNCIFLILFVRRIGKSRESQIIWVNVYGTILRVLEKSKSAAGRTFCISSQLTPTGFHHVEQRDLKTL